MKSLQSSPRSTLPGLQDLKGQWSGSVQAYGGGGGATNVDFNVRGQSWQWGDYALDQASPMQAAYPAHLAASSALLPFMSIALMLAVELDSSLLDKHNSCAQQSLCI